MKNYQFRYGSGTVNAELDEQQVLGVLSGNDVAPLADIRSALNSALDNPVQSEPLYKFAHKGDRVALVVSDMSRFWMRQDLVIPHLVDYLREHCQIPYDDISIVVANGTHTGGDEHELRTLVSDAVFERVHVLNHDCLANDLVYIGTTAHGTPVHINRCVAQADRVICLGAATHHVMAGFGGGRKSILPGVSGYETICKNHAFALDPTCLKSNSRIGNGVLTDNPLNEDMCEAAGLVKNLFMVNLVMNADMKLSSIFAGHYLASWRAACAEVDRIYRVAVPQKADAVITSCGGFPKDMSLYQGTKTIDNIESCLKTGGTLILLIEAREGGGPAEYFGWIKDLRDGTMEKRLREHFTVPGYIFLLNLEQARRYRILMLTGIPRETVAPMGIEAFSDMNALLKAADLNGKSLYVIPNGATVIPAVKGE